MDYKQKYEEALERAKIWQEHLNEAGDKDYADELNYIFPELAESEGEKVRKHIIEVIKNHFSGEDADKCIAWLEKLKVFTEHGNGLYHFANSEFTYVGNTWDNTCLFEKQGEKNPFDYENATIMPKDFAPKVEQKPIWGEEDEQIVHNIRMLIEKYAFSQSAVDVNGDLCEKIYIDVDNWLKSLKQRLTWKPTDKQMKVLDSVIDEYNGYPEFDLLVSLKRDLEKLEGE